MAIINSHPAMSVQKPQTADIALADSSFIQNIKYDAANLQLTITMKSGAQYVHFYVQPNVYQAMMESPSKGRYYNSVIKKLGAGSKIVDKDIGPQNRNPLKGPTPHEQRIRKSISRLP